MKLFIALTLALIGLLRRPEPLESTDSEDSEQCDVSESSAESTEEWESLVPQGVILTVSIMNILKVLTQVINAALVHFAADRNMGSFASMLLLESALEHSQGFVLLTALIFDPHFTSLLLKVVPNRFPRYCYLRTRSSGAWVGWSLVRPGPKDCENTD